MKTTPLNTLGGDSLNDRIQNTARDIFFGLSMSEAQGEDLHIGAFGYSSTEKVIHGLVNKEISPLHVVQSIPELHGLYDMFANIDLIDAIELSVTMLLIEINNSDDNIGEDQIITPKNLYDQIEGVINQLQNNKPDGYEAYIEILSNFKKTNQLIQSTQKMITEIQNIPQEK